jgi:predicted dehydrogenase
MGAVRDAGTGETAIHAGRGNPRSCGWTEESVKHTASTSNDSTRLKAAVIGLGTMGLVHASTIRLHPRIELVAFCDTSKFMIQALKTFFPTVRFFDDFRKMIGEQKLDVVYITTPTGSHAAIAGACARAGSHLFVEKPLATSMKEAESVAESVHAAGVRSHVGYVCRYAPTFEHAKRILDAGALGRILSFGAVKYSSDILRKVEKSWRFVKKSAEGGGGVVNDFACHGIDLLVWMLGEPDGVHARLESWYSADVEDYVHAVLEYPEYTGWIDSSWSMQDYRKPYTRIEVTGDNGKMIVTDSELRWFVRRAHAGYDAGWNSMDITDLYEPVRIFVGDIMFTRQADAFISSLTEGAPTRCTVEEALKTQRVLEAVHAGERRS